jgi:dethiobiotin synthase
MTDLAKKAGNAGFFIAGTDTGVGKTVVSALLVRALRAAGRSVGYFKPVQTGSDDDTGTVRALAELDAERAPRPAVALPRPASVDQAAAAAGVEVTVAGLHAEIVKHFAPRTGAPTCWILEGAGGLRVPLNAREDLADLLRRLDAPVVLVARSGLGTLNHTLLTLEALEARRLRCAALFLVGPPHQENVRTLAGRHPELPIFEVPQFRAVTADALDLWLAANDLGALLR